MDTDILLSFIVPVYNVEKFLGECLESILLGMSDECEIILVNDGSNDSSLDVCIKYASNDTRIRLVHKENGGLSSARNAGLSIASGKYVTFVDSDDRVFPKSISKICQWIRSNGADICFLKSFKLYPDGKLNDLGEGIQGTYLKSQHKEDAVKYLASRSKYPGSAWGKLFRREFLVKNNLHFPYDRRYSEDLGFIRDCVLFAESFDALDVPYYQYRQNRLGSITSKITSKNYYDLLLFITESIDTLTVDKNAIDDVSGYIMSFVSYEYCILMYLCGLLPNDDKESAYDLLKQYRWVMVYSQNVKGKLVMLCSQFLGLRFTIKLLNKCR